VIKCRRFAIFSLSIILLNYVQGFDKDADSTRGKRTTWEEKQAILEWLEMPGKNNLDWINGALASKMKTCGAGSRLRVVDAYSDLAAHVNAQCGPKNHDTWNRDSCGNRFVAFFKNYKAIAREYRTNCGRKFGISAEDDTNTIKSKLEKQCPGYHRMDALYGEKQNIYPNYLMTNETNVRYASDVVNDDVNDNYNNNNNNNIYNNNNDNDFNIDDIAVN
jgi:hypothetical protein